MPSSSHTRLSGTWHGCILLLLIPLAGCSLWGRKQPAAPPPPQPVAVQPPAQEQQLSTLQTSVVLPSPQPVSPDAIPPVPVEEPSTEEKAETPHAPRVSRRPAAPAAGPVKPEPEQAPAPAENAAERPPFQPILSSAEEKRLQEKIDARRREIEDRLARAKGHLSDHDQGLVDRINSFLRLSGEAVQRRDYTQADALSERAWILARELQFE
jgi:hypothetical protein